MKIDQILEECEIHIKKLQYAKEKLKTIFPLTYADDTIILIDHFIFRFSKLQDTIGEKRFKKFLKLAGENVKNKTFIEILNRLEELNILEKEKWINLRNIRNLITHEYPELDEDVVNGLNDLYFNQLEKLFQIFLNLKNKLESLNC